MELHTNGRHDAVDCHIHGVLFLPVSVLSVIGQHYDALVVADHFHWHKNIVDAMCWRYAARHQCNCRLTTVMMLLIESASPVSHSALLLLSITCARRRHCLSRDL